MKIQPKQTLLKIQIMIFSDLEVKKKEIINVSSPFQLKVREALNKTDQ